MWVITLVAASILIYLLIYFFHPIFLRRSFIDSVGRNIGLDIPQTAQIREYRFGINAFGVKPFFAKLELSRDECDALFGYSHAPHVDEVFLQAFRRMQIDFNYGSLNVDDIVEIRLWERRTVASTIFRFRWTSRVYEAIFIITVDGERFLYLFY